MEKEIIIQESEKYFRENIPQSRIKESYLRHVEGARRYALLLAEKYNADGFVVEIAALLHDIGADAGKEHPKKGSEIAKQFLSKFKISSEILNRILSCIKNHSMGTEVDNLEEQIIQDADGIIFLEDTFKYFYEGAKKKGVSVDEEKEWVKNKIKGMMEKIKTDEGKRIAEELLPIAIKYVENKYSEK